MKIINFLKNSHPVFDLLDSKRHLILSNFLRYTDEMQRRQVDTSNYYAQILSLDELCEKLEQLQNPEQLTELLFPNGIQFQGEGYKNFCEAFIHCSNIMWFSSFVNFCAFASLPEEQKEDKNFAFVRLVLSYAGTLAFLYGQANMLFYCNIFQIFINIYHIFNIAIKSNIDKKEKLKKATRPAIDLLLQAIIFILFQNMQNLLPLAASASAKVLFVRLV